MTIFSSIRNKIILLLLISVLIFSGWKAGLETGYIKVLVGTTNLALGISKNDNHIEFERINGLYQFRVFIEVDGRKGNFVHEPGSMTQPLITILSWQIFLFFVLKRKSALQSLGVNIGIFLLIQIIFLILLTGYYSSTVQQYIFMMIDDSFNIITLILIIKDNMLYPVFSKKV
ncbi:MAG: hypothetical protein H8E34_13805 [Bacteroidetes bacterium]|nr:hypothetical protein [Bacteroidota bacterium]